MYKIQKETFGYRLTFGGFISTEEMKQWLEDCTNELINSPKEFVVFVDMRDLKPLEQEAQAYMTKGQILFKEKGMIRSVVVVEKPIVNLQFKKISKFSGIFDNERVLDLVTSPDWEEVGLNWIINAIEPAK